MQIFLIRGGGRQSDLLVTCLNTCAVLIQVFLGIGKGFNLHQT